MIKRTRCIIEIEQYTPAFGAASVSDYISRIALEIKRRLNNDATIKVFSDEQEGFVKNVYMIVRQEKYTHNLLDVLADIAQENGLVWLTLYTDYKFVGADYDEPDK